MTPRSATKRYDTPGWLKEIASHKRAHHVKQGSVPREKMRSPERDARLRMYAAAVRQGRPINYRLAPGGDGLVECCLCGGTIDFCEPADGDVTLIHVKWTEGGWSCSHCTRDNSYGTQRVDARTKKGSRVVRLPSYLRKKPVEDPAARLLGKDWGDAADAADD